MTQLPPEFPANPAPQGSPAQPQTPPTRTVLSEGQRYDLTLSDYWRILLKRRMIILLSFVSSLVVTVLYTNTKIPIYESSATVRVTQGPKVFQSESGFFQSQNNLATYSNLLISDEVMNRVVVRLGLLSSESTAEDLANEADEIRDMISTSEDEVSGTINISVTCAKPEMCAAVANQTAEAFIEVDLLEKTREARQLRGFIEQQLDIFTGNLQRTEDRIREFRASGRTMTMSMGVEQKISDLQRERSLLLERFTEKHPDIRKIDAQLASMKGKMNDVPTEELELARLQRELEINDRSYRMMKDKYQSARLAEAEKVSDVSIVETASIPEIPISPQKGANKMAGALMGIILGVILAFLNESLDTSIGTIEDVERIVRLPVVGIIPFFSQGENRIPWWRFDLRILSFFNIQQEKPSDASHLIMNQDTLSSLAESYRILRTFVEFLIGKSGSEGKLLVFTSTGPQEGKTLTACNLAIALAQAGKRTLLIDGDLRRPTLHRLFGLTRSPGLTDILVGSVTFEDARRTMGDILVGETSQWDHVLTTKMLDRLKILTTGTHNPTPAELLESDAMKQFLVEARKEYAYIVLDTPPVLPVTDARTLGILADAVFFIYRAGKTARRALTRAKDELKLAGVQVKGIILNYATPETTLTDAYYYQYYGEDKNKPGAKKKAAPKTMPLPEDSSSKEPPLP